MKKLLVLLLLSPLASSQTYSDIIGGIWEEFIEEENLQLTHIVCEHSGEQVQTINFETKKRNVSYTDYFLFNDDYLFASLEKANYVTGPAMLNGEADQQKNTKSTVTLTNEVVRYSAEANEQRLKNYSSDRTIYKSFDETWTINRLNGTIKTTEDYSAYAPTVDANVYNKTSTSGTCSLVTDKN